ncbi:Uma2 family endonuclease [Aquisalimonas sp.]|uniref:Uma2 family endonuclease n=1 Tax=Aquisalimonas sp. TaxID=1872621 RepID=UPI0025C703E6|nr:Uma2 family endonuclease [Aquisalimonas sp.]
MATSLPGTGWTYAEFARLPNDGNRYEVIAGELYVTPAPRPRHQLISQRLNIQLANFVNEHGLGWVFTAPIDVLFAEGEYVEPDLVFVRRERVGIISDRGIEAAPDLVVEILSDSTARIDRGPKLRQYTRFGVPLYWIADPETAHVEVYRPLEEPAKPIVHAETVSWTPVPGGPTLSIEVPPLFRGFE